MILILSEPEDFTTYKIAKSLEFKGYRVVVLTNENRITDICIQGSEIQFSTEMGVYRMSEITAYWYRRGDFNLDYAIPDDIGIEFRNDLFRERSGIIELLHLGLKRKPNLSTIFNSDFNRVSILWLAKEMGLTTPDLLITGNKAELTRFKETHNEIIIKPIRNGLGFVSGNSIYVSYTTLFTDKDITTLPANFKPALFMKYIKKKYEVRVFYLNQKCYSMAIFTQSDLMTQIDSRNYNKNKPNRIASYVLPESITSLVINMMNNLKLNTGSIDFIVTPDDEFVFLEINPIGQFLNIDEHCLYSLPDLIANEIINLAKKGVNEA